MTTNPGRPDFGNLDGEVIEAVNLRLIGTGGLTDIPEANTTLTLIVRATVGEDLKLKRDPAGRLIREHKATVVHVAEAPEGSDVAEDAMAFLEGYRAALDTLNGIDRLPLEEEEEAELEEEEGSDD